MELTKLLNESLTIQEAITLLSNNKSISCKWMPVINEKGCLFELGSRIDEELNILKWYASIPHYNEQGIPCTYVNGFVKTDKMISTAYLPHNIEIPNFDEFVDKITNTNFKESWYDVIEYEEVIVHKTTVYKLK